LGWYTGTTLPPEIIIATHPLLYDVLMTPCPRQGRHFFTPAEGSDLQYRLQFFRLFWSLLKDITLVDSQLITGIIAHSCGAHLHTNNISKAYIPGASSLTIPSFACIRMAY
jgi:hypothetical protein